LIMFNFIKNKQKLLEEIPNRISNHK